MKTTTIYKHKNFTSAYKCTMESWSDIKCYTVTEVNDNKTLNLNEREYNQLIDRLTENGWEKVVDL